MNECFKLLEWGAKTNLSIAIFLSVAEEEVVVAQVYHPLRMFASVVAQNDLERLQPKYVLYLIYARVFAVTVLAVRRRYVRAHVHYTHEMLFRFVSFCTFSREKKKNRLYLVELPPRCVPLRKDFRVDSFIWKIYSKRLISDQIRRFLWRSFVRETARLSESFHAIDGSLNQATNDVKVTRCV